MRLKENVGSSLDFIFLSFARQT
mgnify:CR=1